MKEIMVSNLDITAWRRTKDTVRLRLLDLPDGSGWITTAAIIAGKKPGPIVTVVAGQHGDEWNGIFIAHRLFEEIEFQDLKGTLIILPIANPFAFLQKSRISIVDQIDMNRSYELGGERHPTTLAAAVLFEEIFRRSDYVIDLHAGGPGTYVPNAGITEQGRLNLALHFNTGHIVVARKDHGTLVSACERHSVPAFSIQIGHALDVDYAGCEGVLSGIINFFKGVELIPEKPETIADQQLFPEKQLVLASRSGFITLNVALDEEVQAGQKVAEIEPLLGEPVNIVAPKSGRVLYLRHELMVGRGDSLVHLGRREENER